MPKTEAQLHGSANYNVVVRPEGDELYAVLQDLSDGFDLGDGLTIEDPRALLYALLEERFSGRDALTPLRAFLEANKVKYRDGWRGY